MVPVGRQELPSHQYCMHWADLTTDLNIKDQPALVGFGFTHYKLVFQTSCNEGSAHEGKDSIQEEAKQN